MMHILGLSAFYHDSAAVLVTDGRIIAAAQEERFTRKKHDHGFPLKACQYCLREAGITPGQLECAVFYDKPLIKFERLLQTYLTYAPQGLRSFLTALPLWLGEKLHLPKIIREQLECPGLKVFFTEHHEAHAASAFYPSPYPEAAILTLDGVGEWATASVGVGRGGRIDLHKELHFPHSLGLLYSAITYFTGFRVNSGEYKVMGLAPYGQPRYVKLLLEQVVDLKEDGTLWLNQAYFNYCAGLTMTSPKFDELLGGPPRRAETMITRREMDLAASVQAITEMALLRMAKQLRRETEQRYLCLAGGVALNCVANGKLLRERVFDGLWIQPAAGDAGGALGAALAVWHQYHDQPRQSDGRHDTQQASLLGPAYNDQELRAFLAARKVSYEYLDAQAIARRGAEILARERVLGWFQGRMEFGPRALGARSILGDARSPTMQKNMNVKIKFRESFRPFAPAVLLEKAAEYFEDLGRPGPDRQVIESPYMLLVADVLPARRRPLPEGWKTIDDLRAVVSQVRSDVPAITHVDYSARVQTVKRLDNPLYYDLIAEFERLTGCAVIVNTSFNVRGEPIVCTPADAYRCFMRTNIDDLMLGPFLLHKEDQPPWQEAGDWRKEFSLD